MVRRYAFFRTGPGVIPVASSLRTPRWRRRVSLPIRALASRPRDANHGVPTDAAFTLWMRRLSSTRRQDNAQYARRLFLAAGHSVDERPPTGRSARNHRPPRARSHRSHHSGVRSTRSTIEGSSFSELVDPRRNRPNAHEPAGNGPISSRRSASSPSQPPPRHRWHRCDGLPAGTGARRRYRSRNGKKANLWHFCNS